MDFHRLTAFNPAPTSRAAPTSRGFQTRGRFTRTAFYPDAAALLRRYNVAQLQAALYRAERLVVTASEDFKTAPHGATE